MVRGLRNEQTMPSEHCVRGKEPALWGCEPWLSVRVPVEGNTRNVMISAGGVLFITVAERKR